MTETMDLLPCPFCGDLMQLWDRGESAVHSGDGKCPIQQQGFRTDAWNRRTAPDLRETVRGLIDQIEGLFSDLPAYAVDDCDPILARARADLAETDAATPKEDGL